MKYGILRTASSSIDLELYKCRHKVVTIDPGKTYWLEDNEATPDAIEFYRRHQPVLGIKVITIGTPKPLVEETLVPKTNVELTPKVNTEITPPSDPEDNKVPEGGNPEVIPEGSESITTSDEIPSNPNPEVPEDSNPKEYTDEELHKLLESKEVNELIELKNIVAPKSGVYAKASVIRVLMDNKEELLKALSPKE